MKKALYFGIAIIMLFVCSSCKAEEKRSSSGDLQSKTSSASYVSSEDASKESSSAQNQTSSQASTLAGENNGSVNPFEGIAISDITGLILFEKPQTGGNYSNVIISEAKPRSVIEALFLKLSAEKWDVVSQGGWVKFNMHTPNRYALLFTTKENEKIAVNIHYSELDSSRYYVSAGRVQADTEYEKFICDSVLADKKAISFNRYLVTRNAAEALFDIFE